MPNDQAPPEPKLPDYLGRPVYTTTIAITNAGDGLSQALGIAPEVFVPGDEHYVVLKCTVGRHVHDPVKDTPGFNLVQTLKAGDATMVDADLVKGLIDEQRRKIELAREAEAGIGRLGFDPEEAQKAHDDGLHAAGLVPGCPACDDEADQEQAEEAAANDGAGGAATATPINKARSSRAPRTKKAT